MHDLFMVDHKKGVDDALHKICIETQFLKTIHKCLILSFFGLKYTLLQIFIFCPKIQLWFPVKIVDFLGEKLVKMLWFWTF